MSSSDRRARRTVLVLMAVRHLSGPTIHLLISPMIGILECHHLRFSAIRTTRRLTQSVLLIQVNFFMPLTPRLKNVPNWDRFTIVGTNQEIFKDYLRLTAASLLDNFFVPVNYIISINHAGTKTRTNSPILSFTTNSSRTQEAMARKKQVSLGLQPV